MAKPPHAELPPDLARKLQALDQHFRAGLRQRLVEASSSNPDQVYAALHRLVGAAGAYGHTALAAHARQAMDTLAIEHAKVEPGPERPAAHRAAMQGLISEVERLLA